MILGVRRSANNQRYCNIIPGHRESTVVRSPSPNHARERPLLVRMDLGRILDGVLPSSSCGRHGSTSSWVVAPREVHRASSIATQSRRSGRRASCPPYDCVGRRRARASRSARPVGSPFGYHHLQTPVDATQRAFAACTRARSTAVAPRARTFRSRSSGWRLTAHFRAATSVVRNSVDRISHSPAAVAPDARVGPSACHRRP